MIRNKPIIDIAYMIDTHFGRNDVKAEVTYIDQCKRTYTRIVDIEAAFAKLRRQFDNFNMK